MKLFNLLNLGFSTLLLGLISSPAMGASITLDSFSDVDNDPFQFVQDDSVDGSPVTDTDGATTPLTGVLGGTRTISVSKDSGSNPFDTSLIIDTSLQQASFSSPSATEGSFSITYDGDFGTGIDLTNGGANDAFAIDVVTNDLGVTLNFEVFDGTNTATLAQAIAPLETGTTYFSFADFSNQSSLTQAQSITLSSSNEPANLDFEFQVLESTEIPFEFSPSLGIIFCAGLFGIHKLKRKYQNSHG